MKMRKFVWNTLILSIGILAMTSCWNRGKDENHDGERTCKNCSDKDVNGNRYETSSVKIDLDGDGVAEQVDVMFQNINVTANADGTPFYDDGTGTATKYCYKNMDINCDTMGALYSASVSVNQSLESLAKNTLTALDKSGSGVADYLENISNKQSSELAEKYDSVFAKDIVTEINQTLKQAPTSSSKSLINNEKAFQELMNDAIEHVIAKNTIPAPSNPLIEPTDPTKPETVPTTKSSATAYDIDITSLEKTIASEILTTIVKEIKKENNGEFKDSAIIYPKLIEIANQQAETITENIAESVAQNIIATFSEAKKNPNSEAGKAMFVQGICMDGWHIPSDAEWMTYEHAFGMPLADLPQSGIENNQRGKEEGVAKKMMEGLGISLSGYGSVNGTFAQLKEAGVFYSSTGGVDENGEYIWVRHFDDSFESVKRYKHYAKSVLSVRCFKD